jgi:hypothetical protein
VGEFGDLEKKAQAYAEEHPEQADKGINEVVGLAYRDTDHQHGKQIDRAVDAVGQHGRPGPGPAERPELAEGRRGKGKSMRATMRLSPQPERPGTDFLWTCLSIRRSHGVAG